MANEIKSKVNAASGQAGYNTKTAMNNGPSTMDTGTPSSGGIKTGGVTTGAASQSGGIIKTGEVHAESAAGVKTAPHVKEFAVKGATAVGHGAKNVAVDSAKKTGYAVKTAAVAVPGAMAAASDESISGVGRVAGTYETVGRAGVKTVKTGYNTIRHGVKGLRTEVVSGAKSAVKSAPGTMMAAQDETMVTAGQLTQMYGTAGKVTYKGAKAGVKGGKYAVKTSAKAVKTGAKAGVKTAKVVKKTAESIAKNGLMKTARKAAVEAAKAVGKAAVKVGQAAVQLGAKVIAALGPYILIPIVVILLVLLFSGTITSVLGGAASVFSGEYTDADTEEEVEVSEYLETAIPPLTAALKAELLADMTESAENYDIVRLYSANGNTDVLEVSEAGISEAFDTDKEIADALAPLFNAVVLMNYDLNPTEQQTEDLVEYLFSKMYTITTVETTEYCGQDLVTGEGEILSPHSCGSIHALDTCPNPVTGTHSSYTCDDCCYYYCPGHHDDETGERYYCGGCKFACSGYSYCGGHSVLSYTVSSDGIYALVAEYFTDPINDLASIDPRTDEQQQELERLQEYYEIFEIMMSNSSTSYSSSLGLEQLQSVNFITGSRTGNQDVVDLAASQVGQSGGQPYWSYYGFSSRVEWCACFVHWCMRNTSSATGSYPTTSNNAYCQTLANYFKDAGNWVGGSYTDLAPGDVIFFDWDVDGHTDHVGIVAGTDGEKVYTIEGNSGDAVKIKSYNLGSSVIYGYAILFD